METCECRTFAIGRCTQCQTPVCMHHSRLLDGRTLCVEHYKTALGHGDVPAASAAEVARPADDLPEPEQAVTRGWRAWGRRR